MSHGSFETSDTVSKASGGTFAAAMNYPGGAVTGDVAFGDSNKILMGAGSDLQIYHDGTHSRIDNNTGDLFIQSDTVVRITNSAANETSAKFFQDGAAELYHNNAVKLATTATGATITGALATDAGGVALTSLDIDGGTDIGAALVDADLMIVDDGAGGTNRKATMDRLATYMGTKVGASTTTGAVGTYAMLFETTLNSAVRGPGDDLAASSTLYYCSTKGTGDPGAVLTRNTAPSGTWRLMGDRSTHYTENDKPISLWLRIS